MNGRRGALAAVAGFLAGALTCGLLTGLISIHGWDWTAGTNTNYCSVYLPHLDFHCQSGH